MSQLEEQTVDVCAKQGGGEKNSMGVWSALWMDKKPKNLYLRVLLSSLLQPFLPSHSAHSAQTKMQSNFSFKATVFGKWAGDIWGIR